MPEAASPNLLWRFGNQAIARYTRNRDLLVAGFLVAMVGVLIYPLMAGVMDFLLAINITLSLILLLSTIYITRPTDLSVFPSLLLVITLYRLTLNVATTRLILTRAHIDGASAAGAIVRTFGEFVTGAAAAGASPLASLVIGLVIFAIIVVIQFVVITKGATRIAEVAARFTLDAMPGQQMAIDADLNAGLIDEKEARRRREELRQLTDFYGAMDGASKFVRGDAIAGIIITFINIVAGIIIGTLIFGMELGTAAEVFTLLTIGDGLVGQVPALLVSIAAGLLVTRSASRVNFGEELMNQLFTQQKVLGVAGLVLGMMGLSGLVGITPFPAFPLLVLSAICGVNWHYLYRRALAEETTAKRAEEKAKEEKAAVAPPKIEETLRVDPMELELGYALIPLVDVSQGGGGLLNRIQMIRTQLAQEYGIIVPPIRIRDNIQLQANEYLIKIQGAPVARGTAEADKYLAMDSGLATAKVEGIETKEPAFGLPAVWITEANREYAESVGYTVVDAETVIVTHLTEVIKSRAHELLTREEVRKLLDAVREYAPNLVQEVVPEPLSLAHVQKVLQNLLRERVSIRNLPAILEVLSDIGHRTKDVDILTEYCRNGLARWLCNEYAEQGKLYVVTLDPRLEDAIQKRIEHTDGGSFLAMRPQEIRRIIEAISKEVRAQLQAGHNALLLTSPQIRIHVKRMTMGEIPLLAVLSYNEILPEFEVVSLGMVTVDL